MRQLFVGEVGRSLRVALTAVVYLVPYANVLEKAFCGQGRSRAGVANGYDLTLKVIGGIDVGIFAHH